MDSKSTNFKVPEVGTTVTLTTRYPEIRYKSSNRFKENLYENVEVLPREDWLRPSQFVITSNDPKVPFRVIEISNVESLLGGTLVHHPNETKTVMISGSKGAVYHVMVEGMKAKSCDCPGFHFRRTCRHLAEAEREVLTLQGE